MTYKNSGGRWWEFYLVRYLMPSVAGMVFVLWLAKVAPEPMRDSLLIPKSADDLKSATLLLLFLYGNIFCYIASYPILVFHATRCVDAENTNHGYLPNYLATAVLSAMSMAMYFSYDHFRDISAMPIIVGSLLTYSAYQIFLLIRAVFSGPSKDRTLAYGFLSSIASARAGGDNDTIKKTTITERRENLRSSRTQKIREAQTATDHTGEFVESYRHLREHGNSAFIFILELILAAVFYCAIRESETPEKIVSWVAVILAIWVAPAVLVHMLGQILEKEFAEESRWQAGKIS